MELRSVDPGILLNNPANPRRQKTDETELRRLAYNIKAVGIIHPPVVRELPAGNLMIIAGHRRCKAAIMAGLKSIIVHVRQNDNELDELAALSENMIRLAMSDPDMWRAVSTLRTEKNWSDRAICQALMITPAKLKQLECLSRLYPPILDAMNRHMLPSNQELTVIASACMDDQASAWRQLLRDEEEMEADDSASHSSKNPDQRTECQHLWPEEAACEPDWHKMAYILQKDLWYAKDAHFTNEQAESCGLIWQEDLFAQGSTDTRCTENKEGYEAAQRLWLTEKSEQGYRIFPCTTWGYLDLPDNFHRVWNKTDNSDDILSGYYLNTKTLIIEEFLYKERSEAISETVSETELSKNVKIRPNISSTGYKLIGQYQTSALQKAFDAARDTADPWQLVAALILALSGDNVTVKGDNEEFYSVKKTSARRKAAAHIAPEGIVVQDHNAIRQNALNILHAIVNCDAEGFQASGISAQIIAILFNADRFLPDFKEEIFLKTYSKQGMISLLNEHKLLPHNTSKEMRVAFITQAKDERWVPPQADFKNALSVWREKNTHLLLQEPEVIHSAGQAGHSADAQTIKTERASVPVDQATQFMREHFEIVVVR